MDYTPTLKGFECLDYKFTCDTSSLLRVSTVGYVKNGMLDVADLCINVGQIHGGIRRTIINTADSIEVSWPKQYSYIDVRCLLKKTCLCSDLAYFPSLTSLL